MHQIAVHMCEMQFMSKTQHKNHQECAIWLEIIGRVYANDKQHKLGEITTTESIKQSEITPRSLCVWYETEWRQKPVMLFISHSQRDLQYMCESVHTVWSEMGIDFTTFTMFQHYFVSISSSAQCD